MGEHASPANPTLTSREPVATAEIARLIVAVLASFGVVAENDAVLGTITGVVGGLISIGLTLWARRKVTPTAAAGDAGNAPPFPAPPAA